MASSQLGKMKIIPLWPARRGPAHTQVWRSHTFSWKGREDEGSGPFSQLTEQTWADLWSPPGGSEGNSTFVLTMEPLSSNLLPV